MDNTGAAQTPTIYLTNEGKLVFACQLISGPADLVISGFALPLKQWVSVQLNLYKLQMQLLVRDRQLSVIGSFMYTYDHMIKLNYAEWDWNVGGNLWHISVDGAVGLTDVYVNQHVNPDNIGWPADTHANFFIGTNTTPECDSMRYNLHQLLNKNEKAAGAGKELVFSSEAERVQFEDTAMRVGEQLLKQAYPLLDSGHVIEGYGLLVQAECYGSVNASYTKAVIEAPEHPPTGREFLKGSLQGDVLSDLALAFRHKFDTDSEIPMDCESALVYYERLALVAHETMNNVTLHNVWAETVKLSSEKELFDQEGEGSVEHRRNMELAVDGDIEAAKRLGAQHRWGSHGRTKDLKKAYSFYKRAADKGDLQALHETALMKIEGHGTKKDTKAGVEMLIRAAEAGFVASLGGLGWYHSEHTGELEEAIRYYKEGADKGDMNSMYSLGMVYVKPELNGGPRYKSGLEYFELAAAKGHLAASLEAGSLHKFGMGTVRSCNHAVRYYSWIAVKHDALARITRAALEYYFAKEYQRSYLRYQLAAEAGCEASQYNAAYITERENSATFHPSSQATVYHYSLSALQDNRQAEVALKLYNLNLAAMNTEIQEELGHSGDKHKIRTVSSATVKFRGHIHEIVPTGQRTYNISMEYSSGERMVVGVDIASVDPASPETTLRVWSQKLLISAKNSWRARARVTLDLPANLMSLPDKDNSILGESVQVRCWVANIDIWAADDKEIYKYARDRNSIEIIGPWTPQDKVARMTMCMSLVGWFLSFQKPRFPQCPAKEDWREKGYPFIMNGEKCGIAIRDKDYLPQEEGVVTLSVWFKLADRCKTDKCSLLYRFDDSGNLFSPLITLDNKGLIHITVFFGTEGRIATLDTPVPLAKWVHLALSIKGSALSACVALDKTSSAENCQFWKFNEAIAYNENDGMWFMGGNFYLPGPKGWFGSLRVYRDQYYRADKLLAAVSLAPPADEMWNTNTRQNYKMCQKTFV